MKNLATFAVLIITGLIFSSCSTVGHFKLPKGTDLEIADRPIQPDANGKVATRPFFWSAAGVPPNGGVPYKLKKKGKVVKEGKLRVKFRVSSIFWPPLAIIYWPFGLNPNVTYDLIKDTQNASPKIDVTTNKVVKLSKVEPKGCKELGDIQATGRAFASGAAMKARANLRKRAAKMGANYVAMDTITFVDDTMATITGIAYICPK